MDGAPDQMHIARGSNPKKIKCRKKRDFSMVLSDILMPVSIIIEFIIVIIGCYAGVVKKRLAGYLFAVTFLLFGLYDYLTIISIGPDLMAVVNIIAVLAALGGISLIAKKT
jgi:presenilin-like A22 family membrane protease